MKRIGRLLSHYRVWGIGIITRREIMKVRKEETCYDRYKLNWKTTVKCFLYASIYTDDLKGEALFFESTVAIIPPPDRRTLKAFRINFFHGHPDDPRSFPMLGGYGSSLFDDPDDLLVLHTREPPDKLTMFVQDYFGYLFEVRSGLTSLAIADRRYRNLEVYRAPK